MQKFVHKCKAKDDRLIKLIEKDGWLYCKFCKRYFLKFFSIPIKSEKGKKSVNPNDHRTLSQGRIEK